MSRQSGSRHRPAAGRSLFAAALLAICAPLAAAQDRPAETSPPPVFSQCAEAFETRLSEAEAPVPPFGCTRAYFEVLPGSDGTTIEMSDAYIGAAAAADAYLNAVLKPRLLTLMEEQASGTDLDARRRLEALLRSAGGFEEALCALHYDLFVRGSMRALAAGACQVDQSDKLLDSLLRLRHLLGE